MRKKLNLAPEKIAAKEGCCHHWIIESPQEVTSKGVCKFCGEEKEFINYLPFSGRESGAFLLFESAIKQDKKPDKETDKT